MRYVALLICFLFIITEVFAASQRGIAVKMPEGTFKRSYNGKIIQYDKNGKKIGQYKINNGRYYKIK